MCAPCYSRAIYETAIMMMIMTIIQLNSMPTTVTGTKKGWGEDENSNEQIGVSGHIKRPTHNCISCSNGLHCWGDQKKTATNTLKWQNMSWVSPVELKERSKSCLKISFSHASIHRFTWPHFTNFTLTDSWLSCSQFTEKNSRSISWSQFPNTLPWRSICSVQQPSAPLLRQ
jgi:hypothetical protein